MTMFRIIDIPTGMYWTGRHGRPFARYIMRGYTKRKTAEKQMERLLARYPHRKLEVVEDES